MMTQLSGEGKNNPDYNCKAGRFPFPLGGPPVMTCCGAFPIERKG